MKRILFFLTPLLLAIIVLSLIYFFFLKDSGRGALQVTSEPKSNVFLDGKLIGQTPLCKCEVKDMLRTGDYAFKLVPLEQNFTPFQSKITITKSVLTAVDRSFNNGAGGNGSIITLLPLSNKKDIELLIVSLPNKADIFLDNNKIGQTPFLFKNTTNSDHELKFTKNGYLDKSVRVKTVEGYKLFATVFLGVKPIFLNPEIKKEETATSSADLKSPKIIILDTPTGFLRVREGPSLNDLEVGRVNPGEKFDFTEEQDGWFKIKLSDGTGWVSGQFVKKEN